MQLAMNEELSTSKVGAGSEVSLADQFELLRRDLLENQRKEKSEMESSSKFMEQNNQIRDLEYGLRDKQNECKAIKMDLDLKNQEILQLKEKLQQREGDMREGSNNLKVIKHIQNCLLEAIIWLFFSFKISNISK